MFQWQRWQMVTAILHRYVVLETLLLGLLEALLYLCPMGPLPRFKRRHGSVWLSGVVLWEARQEERGSNLVP